MTALSIFPTFRWPLAQTVLLHVVRWFNWAQTRILRSWEIKGVGWGWGGAVINQLYTSFLFAAPDPKHLVLNDSS